MEEVKFSDEELYSNQDESSILSYMQKIYPGTIAKLSFDCYRNCLQWFI